MDSDSLLNWLEVVLVAKGHGSKVAVAKLLGVSPSGLSKLLTRRSGFDTKTLRLFSWILSSKRANYPKFKIINTTTMNGIKVHFGTLPDKSEVFVWEAA